MTLIAGASVEPESLGGHAEARLARFRVPRRVEVVAAFPTTGSGKIQKFRIREEMLQQTPEATAQALRSRA